MTKTTISDAEFERLAEQAAQEDGIVPDHAMGYEAWLEWTGKDDSFVGTPALGIPGTGDLYDAAMRVVRARNAASPSPL